MAPAIQSAATRMGDWRRSLSGADGSGDGGFAAAGTVYFIQPFSR
jgi:hypothetical protein